MGQELMRKCPDGYREATVSEMQEMMNQAIMRETLQGAVNTLNATILAAEAQARASKLELKAKLSELNLNRQQIAETNRRLGITGDEGDVLEDTGALYICMDKEKRIKEIPQPKPKLTVVTTDGNGNKESQSVN